MTTFYPHHLLGEEKSEAESKFSFLSKEDHEGGCGKGEGGGGERGGGRRGGGMAVVAVSSLHLSSLPPFPPLASETWTEAERGWQASRSLSLSPTLSHSL